jgi:cardiolipin synthase
MNTANTITITRILILIPFVALFYIEKQWANWLAVLLYLYACFSDYIDGFVARKKNQESSFGRFLDPVADKILIVTTFIMLAGTDRLTGVSLIPAIVIIGREFIVSGLREFLSESNIPMPVTPLAKWKTGVQMIALSLLLLDDAKDLIWGFHEVGIVCLWIASILTVITGYQYFEAGIKHMSMK